MEDIRKNKNRGYQQLRIWKDSIELYRITCAIFTKYPFELKRIASQSIASVDSVHRNIAEGYCRKSIKEYIQYLYIALSSLGESISGFTAYFRAGQLNKDEFNMLDSLSFKIENGLIKLIQTLEIKRDSNDWIDSLSVKECNELYETE